MELVVLSVAFALGVDARRTVLLVGAIYAPVVVLGLIVVLAVRAKRAADPKSALFCEGVASELRSGSPMRSAITAAADSVGIATLAQSSRESTLAETAGAVGEAFEDVGTELEMTIKTAARSGARTADLFDEIGSLAIAQAEISHEVRVASAPARATAGVFVAVPFLYFVWQARSGSLATLLAASQQRIVTLAGLALFITGLVLAAVLIWRAA